MMRSNRMTDQNLKVFTLEELGSDQYRLEFYREMNFVEYFKFVQENPHVSYSAYQRMYQTIVSYGLEKYKFARRDLIHYPFFDDPFNNEQDAVFGLDKQMMRLVEVLKAGATRLGQERRIILLHGPVGYSKTTIA